MVERRLLLRDPLTYSRLAFPDPKSYNAGVIRSRPLYLALAVFTLAVQAMVAAHSPVLHEEPVSECRDYDQHFCPETVEHHTGPCVLCHVSLNGVYLERIDTVAIDLVLEEMVAVNVGSPASDSPRGSHAPRGTPVC